MNSLPGATPFEVTAIWMVLIIAFFGLAYAMFLRRQVMLCDKGTGKMLDVWDGIRLGANAYLKRQLKTIIPLIFVFTIILFLLIHPLLINATLSSNTNTSTEFIS